MSIYAMRTKFGAGLKVVLVVVIVVFVIGAFWQFGAPGSGGRGGSKDESATIAVVNGDKIPMSAFASKWESVRKQISEQGIRSPLVYADVRSSIISSLIQTQQLVQAAKKMGVDVSDKRVDAEIENIVTEGLKANRRQVLGELTREQEDKDPQKDTKYRSALASVHTSIKMQEEFIRSSIPVEEIRAQLVQEGIMSKVQVEPSSITEQDVKDSYKTYDIKYILMQSGKVSDDQLLQKAQNVVKEARAGTDFVKLAAANSDLSDKAKGSPATFSFDTRFMFPSDIAESIKMLKADQISDPLKSDFGYFIVQMVSIGEKTPEKTDKKAVEERKKAIAEDRQNQKLMELQKMVAEIKDIEILDPEFKGYWLITESMKNFADPEKSKQLLKEAAESLELALSQENAQFGNTDIIKAKLAQVLGDLGETDRAISILSQMIEGDSASIVSADLSKMLGDLLVKVGKNDRALVLYKDASDMARHDIDLRREIIDSYNSMGRKDLAAQEQALIAQKEKELKIWQEKNKGAEMPGKAPVNIPATP